MGISMSGVPVISRLLSRLGCPGYTTDFESILRDRSQLIEMVNVKENFSLLPASKIQRLLRSR